MAANSWRKSTKKRSLVNPPILCLKVIGIVQDNLHMNVFSTDNPFKGSQSHSNMRFKVTAVSYLHSGVNDTDVQPMLSIIFANSKPYSKRLKTVYQGPRGSCLMKKNRGRKSRVRVPLRHFYGNYRYSYATNKKKSCCFTDLRSVGIIPAVKPRSPSWRVKCPKNCILSN
jgi:hypothetical protein